MNPQVADPLSASCAVAGEIADLIRDRQAQGERTVLGLATGRTPVLIYRELVRLHREADLDFSQVVSFNLDEFYGMAPGHSASFRYFMDEHLFRHVNIAAERAHVPSGLVPRERLADWCAQYEEDIRAVGGLDLQLLGLGRNGHIGFNEPGSLRTSRTRLVDLHAVTRKDAHSSFEALGESVPQQAITMGVATILEARRIRVLAFGSHKQPVVRQVAVDPVGPDCPATYLREHGDVQLWMDRESATGFVV